MSSQDSDPSNGSQRQPFERENCVDYRGNCRVLDKIFYFRKNSRNGAYQDAECKFCRWQNNQVSATRLLRHVNNCGRIFGELVAEVDEFVNNARERRRSSIVLASPRHEPAYLKLSSRVDDLLVVFIASHALPISTLLSSELKDLAQMINARYRLPKPTRFVGHLLPARADLVRSKAKDILSKSNNYSLTVELDGWSQSNVHLLAVVITDKEGRSLLLGLIDVSAESNTAEYLAAKVSGTLCSNEIPITKINAIITDEASNYKLARRTVAVGLKRYILDYRCIAHVFNLIGGSIYKGSIKSTLDRLSELISTISRNKVLTAKLAVAGATKLIGSVPTRWYSMNNSIRSILKIEIILKATLRDHDAVAPRLNQIIDDDRFW